MVMLSALLLSLALITPGELRAVADTGKAPKRPPAAAPATAKRPPSKAPAVVTRGKPAPAPKSLGEPQLKRRKPPALDFRITN